LPKIVIVGRHGWNTDINIEMMKNDPILGEMFVFLFNASDNELSWLYDNCLYTVFPSFYEGWGIPVAESLYHGVPAISANVTSLMEIGEGIVEHFSPASTDECLDLMIKFTDPKYLQAAQRKAAQYEPVTWDDTYKQIIENFKKESLI
jgi:glycosyltransferase involved in cell wall biosynthesis